MQTDKEAFWEIVRGGILGLGVVAFFIFMTVLLSPAEKSSKFETVDTYNGCNVVRYTDVSNRWHYLLDCTGR